MRLLIVEDNPEMRRLLRRILAGVADEVSECSDGAEALAAYTERRPDYVLMDIEMKEMDGIAATRQIRAFDPAAQIIIVTNHNNEQLRDNARAAGACGYLLKEDLFEIRRLLQTL